MRTIRHVRPGLVTASSSEDRRLFRALQKPRSKIFSGASPRSPAWAQKFAPSDARQGVRISQRGGERAVHLRLHRGTPFPRPSSPVGACGGQSALASSPSLPGAGVVLRRGADREWPAQRSADAGVRGETEPYSGAGMRTSSPCAHGSCPASIASSWMRPGEQEYLADLVRHARFTRANLEHDVGGNHLIKNVTGFSEQLCFPETRTGSE